MTIRKTFFAIGLSAALLMMCGQAVAQECPPSLKALFPQKGQLKNCSYFSTSPVLNIEASIEIPRPDLSEHPYGFELKVLRMFSQNVPALVKRAQRAAQEEIGRIDKKKAAEIAPEGGVFVFQGPLESKAIPGGKAWYRKITVGSVGEVRPDKVHYACQYYVLDGMTTTTLEATASSPAEADGWLQKIRSGLNALQ